VYRYTSEEDFQDQGISFEGKMTRMFFFADASTTTRVLRENISAVSCDDCHHTQN
jgi:hypothetical protein